VSDKSDRTTDLVLVVRRVIKADAIVLFEAWTRPEHLLAWWGPRPVRCVDAAVDLRVGGRYRIVNELPDGAHLDITGEFQCVEAPHKLVYTWSVGAASAGPELVTVDFEARGPRLTEIVVTHRRIASEAMRDSHANGWEGCLDGLAVYTASPR
jgi:uncharacterized protein YndB with AHSA1/START domain